MRSRTRSAALTPATAGPAGVLVICPSSLGLLNARPERGVRKCGDQAPRMTPLDLRTRCPRGVRETILGYYFLPRTIDKLRAELPGGNIGQFLNHDTGFSAYAVRKLGLDMNEFREVVARAKDEDEVVAWLAERIDPAGAPAFNAKFETFVFSRMSTEDQALVRQRHPGSASRPEMDKLLDIIDADDNELTFAH